MNLKQDSGKQLKPKIILLSLAGLFTAFIIAAMISILMNAHIRVSEYSVDGSEILLTNDVRIALISDLHRHKFDETNQQVVDRVAEQNPDIICIAGDMLESDCTDEEVEEFFSLLSRLMELAPVYFSTGNHDDFVLLDLNAQIDDIGTENAKTITPIRKRLEESGAKFLEEEYVDIEVNGEKIRIGGMYGYAFAVEGDGYGYSEKIGQEERFEFLKEFCDTSAYKILLCHRPDSFIFDESAWEWDIDLILSGHTHNGVVALPIIGSILIPDQGFFPKYDKGVFELGNITMVISAGLDGWRFIPRIFNPPEITSIIVKK